MGTYLVVVLESAVCLALFYLLYKLALSKDTFHRFNRVILLVMLILSIFIPLASILLEPLFRPELKSEIFVGDMQLIQVVPAMEQPVRQFPYLLTLSVLVYAAGELFFLVRLVRNWIQLAVFLRKCQLERLEGRLRLYTHDRNIAPFSWMRNVVVSSKDLSDNRDIILTHELAHIRLGHSWDLLITDLCILLQWFNPAAWLLRQELQTVHEFEADDKVLLNGIDAKKYQLLIIEKAVGTRLYSMANSFNHGSLKKRITMMLKEKSSPWARAKYAVVLPLAAIALVGFARPEFTTLQARSAGEFDQLLSWTEATGPAGPSSTPGPNTSPNANANPQDKSSGNSGKSATTDVKNSEVSNPLVVLDGVPIEPSTVSNLNFKSATQDDFAKVLNIAPSDIKEISVWKGDAAVTAYGEKGRNGVLVITTKGNGKPAAIAYDMPVKGTVVNEADNTPVADANIVEINPDGRVLSATKSGSDGRFNLTVKQSDNRLTVSHISYFNARIPIQKDLTIPMTKKKILLEEAVVKGYQRVDVAQTAEAEKKESDLMVEQMPAYPGGNVALMNYIRTNLKYPAIAIDKNIQGRVICSFVIDASGKVTDVKVVQSIDRSLDAEAVRVVSSMPNWIPGKQNGKDCAVQYMLPINFGLEQYTIAVKKK